MAPKKVGYWGDGLGRATPPFCVDYALTFPRGAGNPKSRSKRGLGKGWVWRDALEGTLCQYCRSLLSSTFFQLKPARNSLGMCLPQTKVGGS